MFEHPLEERCHQFGKKVRTFCRRVKKDLGNIEDIKQLVRASGSVGANYIEANETIGDKDFKIKIKTCRRESKESAYWLELIGKNSSIEAQKTARKLYEEAKELVNIFSAIISKSS